MTLAARNNLVVMHLGFVRRVAREVARKVPRAALDDLIQDGSIGLIQAAEKYDPSKNDNFEGYAYRRVRGAICDSLRRRKWRDMHHLPLTDERIPA